MMSCRHSNSGNGRRGGDEDEHEQEDQEEHVAKATIKDK